MIINESSVYNFLAVIYINILGANHSLKDEMLTNFEGCLCIIMVTTLLAQSNQNILTDLKLNLEDRFSVGNNIYPTK